MRRLRFAGLHTARKTAVAAWVLMLLAWVISGSERVWAHGGEDHVHEEEPAVAVDGGAPRFEARSDLVELLGVYDHGRLTLYVDDYATNAPLTGLVIEISADANSVKTVETSEGRYEATLGWVGAPGHYPLTFLLEGERVSDLLQATLDIPASGSSQELPAHQHNERLWIGAAVMVLVLLLVVGVWRGRRQTKALVTLAMGVALGCAGFLPAESGWAHGGEEHTHDEAPAPVMTGDAPRRLPDGRVFLPKPTQHLLKVRTVLAKEETNVRRMALIGRVIADPAASGVVQAVQSGRIEAGPQGFPVLGQTVKAGQVLAWLAPASSSLERANQQAALAEVESALQIAEQRRTRLESLVGSVPRKEIEAARIEAESLRERRRSLAAGLREREPLKSPVAGVISSSAVVAGQVVNAGDSLFTVLQPDRLWVEALSYDPTMLLANEAAVAHAGAVSATLTLIGRGAALQDQSIPLQFRVEAPVPPLPVGQPVTVFVGTQQPLKGMALPAEALTRNAQGQPVVWVHEKAEVFRSVVVESEPLDGARVMITRGLSPGARVVSQGAAGLGQIR